jgi:hypothetical protein
MALVVVSGALANKHRHGGSAWVRMSWAEALRDAGFEVLFVEQLDEASCVDAAGRPAPFERSANLAAFRAVTGAFGFAGSAALVRPDGGRVEGMALDELLERAARAELLVNIGGHLRWAPLLERLPHRAFVDLDPGYTQIWHAEGRDVGLDGHALTFTVGMNVGTATCALPAGGLQWRPIRQPVVLDRWPTVDGDDVLQGFTTVASWRGAYGPPAWGGRTLGVKAHEFRRFAALPEAVHVPFEVALDIDPGDAADADRLREHGWALRDPGVVGTPDAFRRFVQESGAEFSAAQGVYVDTASGWFSDRTVRYLASGRPALVQDTGFGDELSGGEGLVAFSTMEEAIAGAREIAADYPRHSAAARRLAEEHFAGPVALAPLLEAAGLT